MKVITNHHWRNFLYGYELTAKERADFDYLSHEEINDGSFFRYRGACYDLGEFILPPGELAKDWHGIQTDTYFSGVVIRVSRDGEQYQVGLVLA